MLTNFTAQEAAGDPERQLLKILVPVISFAILIGAIVYCFHRRIITWKGNYLNIDHPISYEDIRTTELRDN